MDNEIGLTQEQWLKDTFAWLNDALGNLRCEQFGNVVNCINQAKSCLARLAPQPAPGPQVALTNFLDAAIAECRKGKSVTFNADHLQTLRDATRFFPAGPGGTVDVLKADNLFGVYCNGQPESVPKDQPIYWDGWQRVADYVNRKHLSAAPPSAGRKEQAE